MRKQCIQSIGMMLVMMVLAGANPLGAQNNSGYVVISGVVKDKLNNKKLEYANVLVPGSDVGTVTNADGVFSLKVREPAETKMLQISHVGYENSTIPLNKLKADGNKKRTVSMTPHSNLLNEVIIQGYSPASIVEAAIRKIPSNYSTQSSLSTGFYREIAQKRRHCINISEAVIDIYKTPYDEPIDRDRVLIYKGRRLLSQKQGDTLAVKLLGGPNMSLYLDIVKNPDCILLDRESLIYYNFRMEEPTVINDRAQYVIRFEPRVKLSYALYYGTLYIDKERLSFTRAEFNLNLNEKNKAIASILKRKPFGLRFKPQEVSYLVTYKERDNVTCLSYIRNCIRFKCDWKRKLFSTNYTIMSEMVITDRKITDATSIPYRLSFKYNQIFSDMAKDFDNEDFWEGYNIIAPTESLENAVSKLKKQQE